MENNMEKVAEQFINAIKTIAEKPENLKNLECYLSHHFEVWMEKYANTPEGLTAEYVAKYNKKNPDSPIDRTSYFNYMISEVW